MAFAEAMATRWRMLYDSRRTFSSSKGAMSSSLAAPCTRSTISS